MEFTQYQREAAETAQYPECHVQFWDNGHDCCRTANYLYPVLGLVGETGEVAEKIKKIIRNKSGVVSEEDRIEVSKELGDVLWYIAALCTSLELDMDNVASGNIAKLQDRLERDKIKSEGDNR